MTKKTQTLKVNEPTTIDEVIETVIEDAEIAKFRKAAEKHFKGPVLVQVCGDEMEAFPLGKQASAPNAAKPTKKPAQVPENAPDVLYVPGFGKRLRAYSDFYWYDMQHGTRELARYRSYIRETKRQALYARHDVTIS